MRAEAMESIVELHRINFTRRPFLFHLFQNCMRSRDIEAMRQPKFRPQETERSQEFSEILFEQRGNSASPLSTNTRGIRHV
jgi:hypothetical protein